MHPHLERCLAIVLDATKDGGAECSVRHDPKAWSVVEIVEHLARAYSGTAKGFERCLEKGAPLATPPTLTQSLQQFALINLGYFPEGRQAPKHIVPTGELDLGAVVDAVRRDLARLDVAAAKAKQALGAGKMLDHPIIGALSVDQWLKFHVVHSRHHAKQIASRRSIGAARA
jgi:hypothetical protein